MSSNFMSRVTPPTRRELELRDEPVWTMVKGSPHGRLDAIDRQHQRPRGSIHGRRQICFSRLYRRPELPKVKADVDEKRAELEAKEWTLESDINLH